MIPVTLRDWTLESLTKLLDARSMEAESFDFKEMLPERRNDDAKRRLRKACAAFANSSGGFLVFGVCNDQKLATAQRLVGIDATVDFPEQFGNYPSECNPSVRWDYLNPAIALPNSKVVHVVHFPRSWNGPHSVGDPSSGLMFPKRTNKGTEYMSYEEVRMGFLGYYEKRLKLQLLQAELKTIVDDARTLVMPHDRARTHVSTASLRMEVLESVLVDTYTILSNHQELLDLLDRVRKSARHVANKQAMFFPTVGLPLTGQGEAFQSHNDWLSQNVSPLIENAEKAIALLTTFLASS